MGYSRRSIILFTLWHAKICIALYIYFSPNSPSACFVREPNLKISSYMGSFTVRGQRGGGGGFPRNDVIFTSQTRPCLPGGV